MEITGGVIEGKIVGELQQRSAGAWVGDANARGLLDNANEIQEAISAAEGVGDDRIQQRTQGRIDPESWTHGSAEQRKSGFMTGFNSLDPTTCDTFKEIT